MESDIRNVRSVCKYGAFGNPTAVGFWIYGKRGDGRTVACKNKRTDDGGIIVWSEYFSKGEFCEDITEFSGAEWTLIGKAGASQERSVGNAILDARRP